jgi:holo-ACP synthase
MDTRVATGTPVSLERMLAARDQRAARQAAALAQFGTPLVSMTVVMPGSVKDGWLPRHVLAEALREFEAVASARRWSILARQVWWQETGPEALYVMDVEAHLLKSVTLELEDRHTLGRLWDLDVLAPWHGALSRDALRFPPRRCLVCERPARECGRSRRHPLEELWATIQHIVDAYDLRVPA